MSQSFSPARAVLLNSQISTERLLLEPIAGRHADLLFEKMLAQPIYDWISSKPPTSAEELRTWWQKRESRLSPDSNVAWLNWAVKRIEDGAYLGKLDAEVDRENVATNIGYIFFPAFWGMGYATEAVLAVSKHLEQNGVTKILATVTRGNEASYRVLEKAGFIRSRVIPNNNTIRGIKFDDIEYIRAI